MKFILNYLAVVAIILGSWAFLIFSHAKITMDSDAERITLELRAELREVMVAEAQKIAAINGIRWSPEEFPIAASYAEKYDLPPAAVIAVMKIENGGLVYKMGVHKVHRGIRATTKPTEQQFDAACRLLNRGRSWLMIERPDLYAKFIKKHGKRAEPEEFIRMFPEEYWDFIGNQVYKPAAHRKAWIDFTHKEFKRLEAAK